MPCSFLCVFDSSSFALFGVDLRIFPKYCSYMFPKTSDSMYDNTVNVKLFIENLTIEDLRNPETWSREEMHSIVKIRPNDDILSVRMEYSNVAKNIGINYLKSDKELWYTVEDVVSSKLLT